MNLLKSAATALLLGLATLVCAAPAAAQTVEYVHTDALGSVVAVTDANRNIVERREYEPYGYQLTPTLQNGPGYSGHVQDAATGLTYMQQRYYDPLLGRFLSVDPVTMHDNGDPRLFNRYAYANNNPYTYVDPDGRYVEAALEVASIAMGATSAIDNVSQGNYGAAAVDTAGVIIDSVLVVVPIAPGVVGAGIQAARQAENLGGAVADSAKGVDFVVTPSGTAVPVSQSSMREGFDAAGFPSRPADKTSEAGMIHEVPGPNGPIDVRTMEGGSGGDRRAVFSRPGTNDPVRMDGSNFPNGTPRADRRAGSHLDQRE
jgi:RHS repeat-associated protein